MTTAKGQAAGGSPARSVWWDPHDQTTDRGRQRPSRPRSDIPQQPAEFLTQLPEVRIRTTQHHFPTHGRTAAQSPSREGLCSRQDTLRTHQDTGAPVTTGSQRCRAATTGGQGQAGRRRARRRSTRRPLGARAEATTRHRGRGESAAVLPQSTAVLAIDRVHELASERGSCPARPQLH